MTWVRDVVIENRPLATTGGHTWAAAYRLTDYLAASVVALGLDAPGLNVLELGAGCGWAGMTLARNLSNISLMCLTEQEQGGACEWLAHNVDVNRRRGLPLQAVRVEPCDWLEYGARKDAVIEGDADNLETGRHRVTADYGIKAEAGSPTGAHHGNSPPSRSTPDAPGSTEHEGTTRPHGKNQEGNSLDLRGIDWDFITGSDLIYNQVGTRYLPRVLAALASDSTKILYCHTKHRFDLLDMEFFEELGKAGLRCEEVVEGGLAAPESPPAQFPPVDLFPEQRIAVYLITKHGI